MGQIFLSVQWIHIIYIDSNEMMEFCASKKKKEEKKTDEIVPSDLLMLNAEVDIPTLCSFLIY
jgi:hypothetical protein